VKVYLVPSFHYDNTWHYSSRYYAKFTSERIIKAAVDILQQDKDFRFTIDHLTSLEDFLKRYPEESDYLREAIRRGRVEIVGPMYTQADSLTVGGESLIRQILYGAKWIRASLDVKAEVEWLGDVYGYCNQLPQILKKSGIEYLAVALWWLSARWIPTHKQGRRYLRQISPYWDFTWEGVDGSRIVVHNAPDYGGLYLPGDGHISACPYKGGHNRRKKSALISAPDAYGKTKDAFLKLYKDMRKMSPPSQKSLFMHLGGDFREPHLKNVDLMKQLNKETDLPEIVFSTPRTYFRAFKKVKLPLFKGEINPLYKGRFGEGYHETKVRIKQLNRQFEHKMAQAETVTSLAYSLGKKYPTRRIEQAYQPILFYQHHDPFIGNIPKREYDLLLRKWSSSLSEAEEIRASSLGHLLKWIKIEDKGKPLVIFNTLSWSRSNLINIIKEFPCGFKNIEIVNEKGKSLSCQIKVTQRHSDGSIRKAHLNIFASSIPACGYRTFYIVKKNKTSLTEKRASVLKKGDYFEVENEFYQAKVNNKGQLKSLYDKKVTQGLFRQGNLLANEFILEEDEGCFCYLKPTGKTWREEIVKPVRLVETGSLFSRLVAESKINEVRIRKELIFYSFSQRIDFSARVHLPDGENLRLRVLFPLKLSRGKVTAESPFAHVERKEAISSAINWVDYADGCIGLTVFNQGIASYEAKKGNFYLNLIKGLSLKEPHTSCLPQPMRKKMIEKGDFQFNYAIQGHGKGLDLEETVKTSYEFNMPLLAVNSPKQRGELPPKFSFFHLQPENLIISTIKKAEQDEGLVLRIYETKGKPNMQGELRFFLPFKNCSICNLLEQEEKPLKIENQGVKFRAKGHEIITLKLKGGIR